MAAPKRSGDFGALCSGKIASNQGESVFVSGSLTRITPGENALRYDGIASGPTLYGYVLQDPVDLIDESGLYWEYSQSTGNLYYVNNQTGATALVSRGYSGAFGQGLNNPAMESVANVGPIPRGKWSIGAPHNELGSHGPYVMNLTPGKGTNTFGRTLFRMHGDKLSGPPFHASHGCIILGPAIRHKIWNSGDHELVVIQ